MEIDLSLTNSFYFSEHIWDLSLIMMKTEYHIICEKCGYIMDITDKVKDLVKKLEKEIYIKHK